MDFSIERLKPFSSQIATNNLKVRIDDIGCLIQLLFSDATKPYSDHDFWELFCFRGPAKHYILCLNNNHYLYLRDNEVEYLRSKFYNIILSICIFNEK